VTVTCSANRVAVGEPLAGTAPYARLWVLLEQPGPWGRDAVVESHLPLEVGRSLAAVAEDRPVRVGLIRSVGAHVDVDGGPRTLLVARTDAVGSWLATRSVDDVAALPGALDVNALLGADVAPPDLPGRAVPAAGHALLVCTNAKRDQCCAVLGRPLAASFAAAASSDPARAQVWETSHTGGHRFAPTFVSLPDGYLFGGPDAASRSVDACRGRSSLPPAAQAAELAVLRHLGASVPRPLDLRAVRDVGDMADGPWDVEEDGYLVSDGDASFAVTVTRSPGPDRPESCGKAAVPSSWFTASVQPNPSHRVS